MLTSERLLKIISILTVLLTVVFSAGVVFTELSKPEKMFDKIVQDKCDGIYAEKVKADSEDDLGKIDGKCLLVKDADNDFFKHVTNLGKLNDHHYLYFGTEGVLLKKGKTDFTKQAEHIKSCLRNNECDLGELVDSKLSVTGLMYDRGGNLICSNSFFKTSLSQVAPGFNRLFTEMAKVNKKEISDLSLKLLFHHDYTFIEKKEPAYINKLLNKNTDGLYIDSRGAKIRLLPFEYSDNAMKVLDRKARQYGLKKDEYKDELAKIYIFRTTQYFENRQELVLWEGTSAVLKKDYSDKLAFMFLKKHLDKAIKAKKRFALERTISDGKRGKKDAAFFTQLSFAEVMIEHSLDAMKIVRRFLKRDLSNLSSSYFFNILNHSEIDSSGADNFKSKMKELYSDPEKIKTMIKDQAVFSGIFLESHRLTKDSSSLDKLFNFALAKFKVLPKKDKIRFILYLGKLRPEKNSAFYQSVFKFINSQAELIKSTSFKSGGFYSTLGSVSLKKRGNPDTALSLALASGLSELRAQGLLDSKLAAVESRLGNFLRFLIVTGDDFPRWKDPKVKTVIQGGVRTQIGSKNIKLSNTVRAFSYFNNRLNSKNEQ